MCLKTSKMTLLHVLYSMCGNNLGPEGVLELWDALEHNTTVEELFLDITGITEKGTENIVQCLSRNTSLKLLT